MLNFKVRRTTRKFFGRPEIMPTVTMKALTLGPHANGLLLNPWEFDAAEFEPGWRYELINGVLTVNPPPSIQERDPNEELGRRLRNYQESHPDGAALDFTVSEQTVHIGPQRRRVDRAIWTGLGRLPHEDETPTITVEFVSRGRRNWQRDYQIKRDEYRSAGVREYWVIDRFQRRMTVFRFSRGETKEKTISPRQTYSTPLLPGFKLPLAAMLELMDRWNEKPEL
jgi:Uma2 family endonuclease